MDGDRTKRRAQSSILGVALLVAIVLAVSASVVVIGGAAIQQSQSSTSAEGAAVAMAQFDEAVGGTSGVEAERSVSMPELGEGTTRVEEGEGHVTVEVEDPSGSTATVVDTDLGRVVSEQEDRVVAYQAGGVWRKSAGSEESAMVSPPNFEYRSGGGEPTLSLPLVVVEGSGGELTLVRAGQTKHFPNSSAGPSNPIEAGSVVRITVESEFYRAWGEFFDGRTSATPTYDHANQRVTIELDGEDTTTSRFPGGGLVGAVSTTEETGQFLMRNHNAFQSYDSRPSETGGTGAPVYVRGDFVGGNHQDIEGDLVVEKHADINSSNNANVWTVTGETAVGAHANLNGHLRFKEDVSINGKLTAAGSNHNKRIHFEDDLYVDGDVDNLNDVKVHGDLHVNGDLTTHGPGTTVEGEVYVSGDTSAWNGHVDGTNPDPPASADIPAMTSLSPLIDQKGDEFDGDNANDGTIADVADTNDSACDPECRLTSGRYYVGDGIDLGSGERLVLDTNGGPIELHVGENVMNDHGLEMNGGQIRVTGPNPVRVYNDDSLSIDGGTIETDTPKQDATLFWMYMHPDEEMAFAGSPTVTGVYCAPGSLQDKPVQIDSQLTINGSLVAEMDRSHNHFQVNFDEAILDASEACGGEGIGIGGPNLGGSAGDTVGYLHVSSRTVNVRG